MSLCPLLVRRAASLFDSGVTRAHLASLLSTLGKRSGLCVYQFLQPASGLSGGRSEIAFVKGPRDRGARRAVVIAGQGNQTRLGTFQRLNVRVQLLTILSVSCLDTVS